MTTLKSVALGVTSFRILNYSLTEPKVGVGIVNDLHTVTRFMTCLAGQ